MMNALIKSFGYAWKGIVVAIREQRNLRIHLSITSLVVAAGFYFHITAVEWCILLLSIGLVIGLELINSSIENLVDLVTRERQPLAGKVKDIAAGAVLIVSVISVIIGLIIFLPYISTLG
ncbi:diacylglycerol kinase family protein [Ohtaekwangia koreensis]|uniref:Diacylglycerol kinase (ATP) n=1 Tax=Ohtaekwangia koreensis TaxID=688867 RepID=A0A1T5MDU6_9BACT|nr:diacylglycerol kinase family protein [Ohtaekwangia koreensis]SKC86390.1 diacylglycerol kinase (ATP) [Ohtaekwangia koreensis]